MQASFQRVDWFYKMNSVTNINYSFKILEFEPLKIVVRNYRIYVPCRFLTLAVGTFTEVFFNFS